MKTKQERTSSDLEDGEIREEGFEDISDCSLSEIVTMSKELESEDEVDIDLLREEALKSMRKSEEDKDMNEEELEEELCRLEALKSLLKNIEASENVPSIKEIEKKHRPKRKRKQASKHKEKKSRDQKNSSIISSPVVVKETREDPKKPCRQWYPTIAEALICILPPDEPAVPPPVVNIETKPASVVQTVSNVRRVTYVKPSSPPKNRLVKDNVNKSHPMKPDPYKKVTKHSIRKFDSALPIDSFKPFVQQNAIQKGKYKLVNRTNCVPNQQFPASKPNGLRNQLSSKSVFSLNRLKCPKVEEFIIDIDDRDSDAEETIKSNHTTNGAKTPLACDIGAKRDNLPCQHSNEIKLTTLVTTADGTNASKREPVADPARSPIPRINAVLVDSVKSEPLSEDDKTTCSSKSDEVLGELVNTNTVDMSVLVEAEGYLVKIREKLLSDLGDLDRTTQRNAVEQQKLNALLKKLDFLKSMVAKFESKIKLQRTKLSATTARLNCAFNGVQTRTLTCSKFEEVCHTVGKNLIGPLYKPPTKHASVIAEKRRKIDLSKSQPAVGSK